VGMIVEAASEAAVTAAAITRIVSSRRLRARVRDGFGL
jgi:hypothetical protein